MKSVIFVNPLAYFAAMLTALCSGRIVILLKAIRKKNTLNISLWGTLFSILSGEDVSYYSLIILVLSER